MSQVKSPFQRARPVGAREPVAVRAFAALLPLVLILLLVGPAAAGSSSAFRSVALAAHRYDGAAVTRATALFDVRDFSADQGPRVAATYSQTSHGGYDDRSNLARTTARFDGYRLAPQTAVRGGAGPVRVGQQGLDAVGVTQNTMRIALPGGRYRVPDILDEAGGVIGEVKNVQSLSYTSQLRDYASYAQGNGLQFDLYVRGSTRLSGPLQRAVDDGFINLFRPL